MDQPLWMAEAWQKLGAREVPGRRHSRDILAFFRDAGRSDITRDEVPWCAAFVGACLERAGYAGTGSLLARSYLDWGTPVDDPRPGALAVLKRGRDPGAGHVGFWIGSTDTHHILLGGNQSDAVTVSTFDKHRLLGFRWPLERATTGGVQQQRESIPEGHNLQFEEVIGHILEMEGGFTDDPDDPGGPTNKGIILTVYARHTGRALNAWTRAQRVEELRNIPDSMVEEIYRERYWTPSRAAEMPPAIAFMPIDATVNQGLTGAARLVQMAASRQSPRLEIDGEIGPLTMAAIARSDPARLLSDYAEARRTRYRALRHVWKFGRGWLNRVDITEARARRLLDRTPAPAPRATSLTKGTDMIENATLPGTSKWWGSSMTIWGAAITALSTVVPILGPVLGFDVTPDVVREAGEQFIAVIQAIGGLMGTLMTIYGRARASQGLVRRHVQVQI